MIDVTAPVFAWFNIITAKLFSLSILVLMVVLIVKLIKTKKALGESNDLPSLPLANG